MPKVVDPTIQREDIRSAARSVFARRGVRGTGLAHVAEAAGMARSSLYHYYPDKDSLLADLLQEMLEQERLLFRSQLRAEGTPIQSSGFGHAVMIAFTSVASGIAKNTPQRPHQEPKTSTAVIIAIG